MTTYTKHLGWSGHSDSTKETRFNERIVKRTNRVLKKLGIDTCSLSGNCALSLDCDFDNRDTIENVALALRRVSLSRGNITECINELITEYTEKV